MGGLSEPVDRQGGPARPDANARRVGVLGGSFDPIHYAHLLAAEEAADALGLEVVVLVPAGNPPHKLGLPISDAGDRLAMVDLAIAGNPRLARSRADIDRPGPHYTVEMLDLLRAELGLSGPDGVWFVLGSDSLCDLPTWHDPAGIVARARLALVDRPDHEPDVAALERVLPGLRGHVDRVPMPLVGLSGTEIRQRVAEGRTIRYRTPPAVVDYIRDRGLYRPPRRGERGDP